MNNIYKASVLWRIMVKTYEISRSDLEDIWLRTIVDQQKHAPQYDESIELYVNDPDNPEQYQVIDLHLSLGHLDGQPTEHLDAKVSKLLPRFNGEDIVSMDHLLDSVVPNAYERSDSIQNYIGIIHYFGDQERTMDQITELGTYKWISERFHPRFSSESILEFYEITLDKNYYAKIKLEDEKN